jgi:hypothetical protein
MNLLRGFSDDLRMPWQTMSDISPDRWQILYSSLPETKPTAFSAGSIQCVRPDDRGNESRIISDLSPDAWVGPDGTLILYWYDHGSEQ